jgi:hypothetical protein
MLCRWPRLHASNGSPFEVKKIHNHWLGNRILHSCKTDDNHHIVSLPRAFSHCGTIDVIDIPTSSSPAWSFKHCYIPFVITTTRSDHTSYLTTQTHPPELRSSTRTYAKLKHHFCRCTAADQNTDHERGKLLSSPSTPLSKQTTDSGCRQTPLVKLASRPRPRMEPHRACLPGPVPVVFEALRRRRPLVRLPAIPLWLPLWPTFCRLLHYQNKKERSQEIGELSLPGSWWTTRYSAM